MLDEIQKDFFSIHILNSETNFPCMARCGLLPGSIHVEVKSSSFPRLSVDYYFVVEDGSTSTRLRDVP